MSSDSHTFRIDGMHCASCALLIDDALADLPGIRSTQTSMKQSCSIVEPDPGSSPADVIADVMAAVAELGYTAHHTP